VKNVPDARIEQPNDVIIKITTTNICGSDLHMYEGRTDFKPGGIFGHENTGEVVEVGPGISRIKKGDQVSLPFNIGCGFCKNCEAGLTAFCLTVNPGMAGAAYGFADMGPFLRVDKRNTSASPTATSTACAFLRTPGKSRTIMHSCPIYFPPVGTAPALQVSNPASPL
jgi:threonine dehydrogenase-like Zn-dependent dehydrogenase